MTITLSVSAYAAAQSGAASFLAQLGNNPQLSFILVLTGILFGLFLGFLYSYAKSKFSRTEAAKRLEKIVANFEQEKGASETILRELQVGILAYGGDGKLLSANPSAHAILESDDLPKTMQAFLQKYGNDNGIQAGYVLQTPNITGIVNIRERTVRLRLTQSQLAQYNRPGWIIIIQDITEQEREEKQRKEFVANVSHELKTPLTTISAYSETLLDWGLEGKPISEVRTDIMRIHDDAERMDQLVRNLLLLSAIDSRGIRPQMVQYDVVPLMKQVVSRMQVQAVEKDIQLESSVLSIIPPVFGDPSAIDRVITNLVSNGIKYTEQHGYVSVSVQLTNDYISLKVADNGMGVAKDNLAHLFDRFYRVDSTGSRKYGGTGLGLSIAKELTEIQGGTITVASVLGKGTEFVVTIPKAEKTYREALTAIFDGSPRHEIVYENAQAYLATAAQEIDIPVSDLSEMSSAQIDDLLSYLLAMPPEEKINYSIVSQADMLPARYEAENRSRISREKAAAASRAAEITMKPHPAASDVIRPDAVRKAHKIQAARKETESEDSGPKAVSRSAVRRAAMESTGELPRSRNMDMPQKDSPSKAPRSTRSARREAEQTDNITIDQIQTQGNKGEHHAKLSN